MELRDWDKGVNMEKEVSWYTSVQWTRDGDRDEGVAKQVVCYRAGMRLGDCIWKRGGIGKDLQLAYLFPWVHIFNLLIILRNTVLFLLFFYFHTQGLSM